MKYPRAFFCCDCYSELIAGALFFIRDFRYKSFQMRIGFAHFFQIVDLRFCHDGPMIIDAFKAIKRRRLFIRSRRFQATERVLMALLLRPTRSASRADALERLLHKFSGILP